MQLCLVGANHNTMPVELRERVAVGTEQLPEVLSSLLQRVSQAVLLSTCNRTEVYVLDAGRKSNLDAAIDFLAARAGTVAGELWPYLYTRAGEDAVRHLFRVASGLDSMVIGEHEVLGQVRQALERAERVGRPGLPLANMFRHAVTTGRRVRAETRLSRNALSVSSVAVDLATKTVEDLAKCHTLVIGAGEAGKLVARALKARGASRMTVTSRSLDRASALADSLGGHAVPFYRLQEALRDADVVIACTGAPHTILDRQTVESAMSARPDRPMVLVDISVPRNVDPDVKHATGVFLYDIDDLTGITQVNELLRRAEVDKAMEIVDAEVSKYMAWFQTMGVKPIVSALVSKAEAIRKAQIDVVLKRLPNLSEDERVSIEAMTRAIVKRVLDDPIRCLKRECGRCNGRTCYDNEVHVRAVSEMFRLGNGASP